MSSAKKKVCIVGAGPGGLANALLMARAGADVTVFERSQRVGGRCSAIHLDRFRFDTGPTFFHYPKVLEEIFRMVGRDLWAEIPMTRLDPQYRLVFGRGGQLDTSSDPTRMSDEIRRFSPRDADSFAKYMADNREKLERFRPILEQPFSSAFDLLRPSVLRAAPLLRPWHSVASDLGKYFSDPRLVTAFSFQSKYLGMSPFQCPSLFTILAFLEYEFGIFHPIGGCAAVTERMAEIARELGVTICLDEPIEQLHFQGRRAVALTTKQGVTQFDSLVINADFAKAMERFVPDQLRRKWNDRKLAKSQYSCSTFMMYLGIEGSYDEVSHHTIYIADDYEKNLEEIDRFKILSSDPSFYVQNAGVTDSTLAPNGMSTLYVLTPVPHKTSNIDWDDAKLPFRNRVIHQLKKIGIHDVEKRIRVEKIITPADWESNYQIYRGATFNLTHNLGQMLHNRPHNQFEDLEHVYLVGGGTHPGSGLPVIFESAKISARMMCKALDLSYPDRPSITPEMPAAQEPSKKVA